MQNTIPITINAAPNSNISGIGHSSIPVCGILSDGFVVLGDDGEPVPPFGLVVPPPLESFGFVGSFGFVVLMSPVEGSSAPPRFSTVIVATPPTSSRSVVLSPSPCLYDQVQSLVSSVGAVQPIVILIGSGRMLWPLSVSISDIQF